MDEITNNQNNNLEIAKSYQDGVKDGLTFVQKYINERWDDITYERMKKYITALLDMVESTDVENIRKEIKI